MVDLNEPWRALDLDEEKKMQIQSPKGRTMDIHATYMVNSSRGKVA